MMFSKSMLDKFATKLEHLKVQNNKIINHNHNTVMTHASSYKKMDSQQFPPIDNIHQIQSRLQVIQNMAPGVKEIKIEGQQQCDRISKGHRNTSKYIDNSLILNNSNNSNNNPIKQYKNQTNNNNISQKTLANNNKKQAIVIQLDSDSNIKQQYNDKPQSIIQQPSNLHTNINNNNQNNNTSKQQPQLSPNNKSNIINNTKSQNNQHATVQNSIQYKDMKIKKQHYRIILDFLKNNDFAFMGNQDIKGNQQIRQVRQDLMVEQKGQISQAMNQKQYKQKKQVKQTNSQIIIKQHKNKKVANSLIQISQIQQQIQHYQPTQPIQASSPIKPKQIKQKPTPQPIPTSILNNLVQLYPILPAQIIKLYISQLSKQINISFINILVSFGIEQTINKFYQTHQVDNPLTQQYILSEIQIILPYFLCKLAISDWRVIQRIARGLCTRYKVQNKYTDQWLLNIIRKKINTFKASGVNIQQIIAMAKIHPIESLYNRMGQFNSDQPTPQMYNRYNYTSLTQYLLTQPQNITSTLNLQPVSFSYSQLSQKQGIRTNLSYYTKLLQNKRLRSKQLSSNSDKNQNNKNEYKIQQAEPQNQQQLIFQIRLSKSTFLQNTVVLDHIREMEDYYTFESEIEDNKEIKRLGKNRNKVTNNKGYGSMSQYVNKSQRIKNKNIEKQRNLQLQKQELKKQARTVRKTSYKIPNNQQNTVVQTKNYHVRKTISTQPSIPILPTKPTPPPITHLPSPKQTQQIAVNQQKILQRMDKMIYSYHQQYPNFTMNDLLSYIDKVLKTQLQVPVALHKQIIQAWFNKYKKG